MEMKLDQPSLIRYRSSKAWSQQQVADICGLSLRTIQRAENSGRASQDTCLALASAFDVEVSKFIVTAEPEKESLANENIFVVNKFLLVISLPILVGILIWLIGPSTDNNHFERAVNSAPFSVSAEMIEQQQGLTRYSGNVEIQIPTNQITEIESQAMFLADEFRVLEGDVKIVTQGFVFTFDAASTQTTGQFMRITSSYAERIVID